MTSTRVGYVVSQFPCYDETFILREMKALRERGVDIVIFSLRRQHQALTQEDALAFLPATHYAPYLLSFRVLGALADRLLRSPSVVLGLASRLVRDLWRRPVALAKSLAFFPKSIYFAGEAERLGLARLHAHWATHPATAALLMSRLSGVPWSFTCHAHDIFADPILLTEKLRSADFALTCTGYNKTYLASLDRVDPERVRVSYHGLDLALFQPNGGPAPREEISILAVGSLLECKGFRYLIAACALLAARGVAFRATIAGGGPLEDELKALAARHGLTERIRFTGFITQEALVPLYQSADLFVLPSVPEIHWGIPNVLVEAFACGLPVVTTRLPSVPELVDDGVSGVLLDSPDPEAIAASIETLAANPERRESMGRVGRARVAEAFDIRRNTDALVELMTAAAVAESTRAR